MKNSDYENINVRNKKIDLNIKISEEIQLLKWSRRESAADPQSIIILIERIGIFSIMRNPVLQGMCNFVVNLSRSMRMLHIITNKLKFM